jgi:hypothetical protein
LTIKLKQQNLVLHSLNRRINAFTANSYRKDWTGATKYGFSHHASS